jgi:hypothetical protein
MRPAIAILLALLLGTAAGAGGMLVAYPFLFPPAVVAEKAPRDPALAVAGTFKFDETSPGRDAVHWANGTGTVFAAAGKTVVRLEADFQAGPGPNYWIYLNTAPVGDEAQFQADAGRVRIAPLKSFTGSQNYELPEGIALRDFASLTIWCETFSAFIATANLPR